MIGNRLVGAGAARTFVLVLLVVSGLTLTGTRSEAVGALCAGAPASDPAFDASGQPGPAILDGTGRGDVMIGSEGDDTIDGAGGDDRICGGNGNDSLTGGPGADTLSGGGGNDSLAGGPGADTLAGDDGDDTLAGGDGPDKVYGGPGDDLLRGDDDGEVDKLFGDAGVDACFFGAGDGFEGCEK